jgi:hypothetical protein
MMMTMEPTLEQRTRFQNLLHGQLALVQFHSIKNYDAYTQLRLASERRVKAQGGQRTHDVQVDQILAGGEMSFQAITVDRFSSPGAAVAVFDAVSPERQAALSDLYAIVVKPNDSIPRLVKSLGFLSSLLSHIMGTTSEKEMIGFREVVNSETSPVPKTVDEMRQHDQSTPFYMMNLNKYYPTAQYKNGENISGEQAYKRYSSRILPYLVSVDGYPDIIGHVLTTLVGDETNPLHENWSDFAMVYYPSRSNFLKLMTNTPRKGIHHRDAGLQRAILMPSSDWV